MSILGIRMAASSSLSDWSWRRRFSLLTVATTVLLISWGGFVTSINAGMAFPDWPTSLGSYNWFNPVDEWWTITPYLAEHGHRLIASLVGALTVILAVWTWMSDPRSWMRTLGWGALALVIAQGVLGGLRVLWVSLDLAMVHACVAQVFFALLVAMTLFTTETWRTERNVLPDSDAATRLRRLCYATTGLVYVQIVLGALLRHPGGGLDMVFATIHVAGAFAVVGLVVSVFVVAQKHFAHNSTVQWAAGSLLGAVGLQFALGLAAFVLMLYEAPQGIRSVLQIGLTVAHLVVGALLFGSSVVATLLVARTPDEAPILDPPIRDRPSSDPVPVAHEA
jgi:cytochrome c oxidase assembly protein subunit 15